MPTLEIHSNIVGSSHLNFDHIMCVCTAAGIAAVGLLTDSSPFILASFFISPLMGMIMAVTWSVLILVGLSWPLLTDPVLLPALTSAS